jgi:hypothetical protein
MSVKSEVVYNILIRPGYKTLWRPGRQSYYSDQATMDWAADNSGSIPSRC